MELQNPDIHAATRAQQQNCGQTKSSLSYPKHRCSTTARCTGGNNALVIQNPRGEQLLPDLVSAFAPARQACEWSNGLFRPLSRHTLEARPWLPRVKIQLQSELLGRRRADVDHVARQRLGREIIGQIEKDLPYTASDILGNVFETEEALQRDLDRRRNRLQGNDARLHYLG